MESPTSQSQSAKLDDTDLDEECLTHSKYESLESHTNFAPTIGLPNSLYAVLENHCRSFENPRSSSVKLSTPVHSWCSVLHLLQTYLNGFPYFLSVSNSMGLHRNNMNLFPSGESFKVPSYFSLAVFRERFSKAASAVYAKIDRNRHICAEFCCSVRILFDALLDEYLLYPSEERKQS